MLGDLDAVQRLFDHAIPHYTEAITVFITTVGSEHPDRFWPEISYVEAALALGDQTGAREHLSIAQQLAGKFFDPTSFAADKVVALSARVNP